MQQNQAFRRYYDEFYYQQIGNNRLSWRVLYMEKVLLIMMLTSAVEPPDSAKEKSEQRKSIQAPPIERHELIRICGKNEIATDCRHITQAEISSGTVRGMKIEVDNPQP
jgi:hypothetical protein